MRIRLGLHLDGQRGWHPSNRMRDTTLGPTGLLSLLETQLGLLRNFASQSERIVQYRDSLRRCNTAERFYHRTFSTDELGTAATLLGWRDLWYLHGWSGTLDGADSLRLRDMHEIEQLAAASVDPGVGERLSIILAALDRRCPAIDEIELIDALDDFPLRWQQVLGRLPVKTFAGTFLAPGGRGFLGDIQRALIKVQAGESVDKLAWRDDQTIVVAQAETRLLGGRWLASRLPGSDTLVVSSAAGALLDGIAAAADSPRLGIREASGFRPTLQVLPLALEIIWEPLNFYGLLQFLTHSVCPVPGFARRVLAGKLADKPGIGGNDWTSALEEVDTHYGEKAAAIRAAIALWVEHPRYPQETGAPLFAVLQRVEHLVGFFQARLGDDDQAARIAYFAGFAQCSACAKALAGLHEQGMATISPRQLQKLVAQATARGSENPLWEAEVGAPLSVTEPAAAIERFSEVVWWQMEMPALPDSYPWSLSEIEDLSLAGARLPPIKCVLEQTARQWLRPILAATEQLLLILPPKGQEVHPAWLMIAALVDRIPITQLESDLLNGGAGRVAVVHAALPALQRWWVLPADIVIPPRSEDSFSSLELFLFNPYQWLLRYPAKLKSSRILEVSTDFRLYGNLAHALVDRFFQQPNALTLGDTDVAAWFDATFDRLVVEEGAVLLMPGRRSDLEGFRLQLRRSLLELRRQLRDAGVSNVLPELELEGHYPGGALRSFADLTLDKASGEAAIIDMKWAGAKKYPQKLRENSALQLAIYGELLRQKRGAWPKVAYYILCSAELYATDASFFPSARAVRPNTDEGIAQLWLRFVETWKWRQAQTQGGRFEVVMEDVEADEDSVPPDNALAIEVLNPSYNEFRVLAGWRE